MRSVALAAALVAGLAGTALAGAMQQNTSGTVARTVRGYLGDFKKQDATPTARHPTRWAWQRQTHPFALPYLTIARRPAMVIVNDSRGEVGTKGSSILNHPR